MLFVPEVPQELERQSGLGKDADGFGSADIGIVEVTPQPQDFGDPVDRRHEPDNVARVGFGNEQFQSRLSGAVRTDEPFGERDHGPRRSRSL
jgi:hypothetical protein